MSFNDLRWVARDEVFTTRPHAAEGLKLKGLWVAGSLAGLARRTIAVVGTRAPSDAGRRRAHEFGSQLARAGVCVISGLALGVDGAAHAGAVEAGAPTIGVLGGGHNEFYPKRNRQLAEAMLASGGAVVSPFAPEHPAHPPQFLQRNGIVAALAEAVVVIEAAERSGALNTAGWAAARSVPVFALPGDVDRPKAAGCNALIRDGATLVRNAEDVLADLGFAECASPAAGSALAPTLRADPLETALLAALADPCDLESLLDTANASTGTLLAALMRLEIDGLIERRGDGTIARLR